MHDRIASTLYGCLFAVVAAVAFAVPAEALSMFTADLTPLNNSGVTGQAWLTLDQYDLTVKVEADGLEAGQIHPMHIHGLFDGNNAPVDSRLPTAADDADGDGFIEVAEGAAAYGPIILPLTSPAGGDDGFPTAEDGSIRFEETYDLRNDDIFAGDFIALDLAPLAFRELVLHGMTVASAGADTPGEVDGEGGYKPTLPVAAGSIVGSQGSVQPVPEPGTVLLLGSGLISLIGISRRRSEKNN